ncbi:metal ABC transporter ATP-binding protein [Falsiroseomonas oryziterrae]|uniref:metal ABC transporter ATP-binding protein n=1 Tax=Falsiroseomonas oryziterrae TaxID=2911368 RepID=UPI001F2AE914|nr:ABC transporter ATP-binding protein [Roseomonas sp. NPKOSM-4]
MSQAPAPLSVSHLTVAYGERPAVWDVTWAAPPGLTAIVGPNGAGKSTLLKAALGLVPVLTGQVRFFGRPLEEVRDRVGYLPQRASVDWDFPATALDVVCMARYPRMRWWGRVPRRHLEAARAALAQVGMEDFADRQIGKLSGGQQQRVFLARALAQDAELVLMDEPFAAVDAATEAAIVAVLRDLAARGRHVVAVHHDLGTVPEYFESVLLLNARVFAQGPVKQAFTTKAIGATYGARLALLDEASVAAGADGG